MTDGSALRTTNMAGAIREEWFLGVSVATSLAFLAFSEQIFAKISGPFWFAVIFLWRPADIGGFRVRIAAPACCCTDKTPQRIHLRA